MALISCIAGSIFSSASAWAQADPGGVWPHHASRPADNATLAGVERERSIKPPVQHVADSGAWLLRKPRQPARNRTGTARTAAFEPPVFESALDVDPLVRRLLAGVLLSGALFVSLFFLRTGRLRHFSKRDGTGRMELLDTLVLAPRCCLHLVRVHDQVLVVGRDAAGMQQVVPMYGSFEGHLSDALPDSSLVAIPNERFGDER